MTSPWQPPDQVPASSPERPRPRYGEYAPPGYVSPVPPAEPAPAAAAGIYYQAPPVVRTRHNADVVVTCVLLALGLVGMLVGISVGATLDHSLSVAAQQYGVTYEAPASIGALGAFVIWSHVVLYVAALVFGLLLVAKRRISFWVPLTAGIVAGIILWVVLLGLILSDHALMTALSTTGG